jgi:hypothetical protein
MISQDEGLAIDRYVEIDVPDTVAKKASAIRSKRTTFAKHLPNLSFKSTLSSITHHSI